MRERLRSDERGFTLLELLVAVTIISILLAISAQAYYQQRRKGWMAQVKSSVRNMAGAENSHVYAGGFLSFAQDLDDLWEQGYRYSTDSVIPHVALATSQNFCIQVNSAHDPTIVWHFSSEVGYPQEGPATASSCGDLEGAGTYVASGSGERDGITSSGIQIADPDPGVPGGAKTGGGDDDPTGTTGGSTTGTTGGSTTTDTSTSGGTSSVGTTDPTSGTTPPDDGGSTGTGTGGGNNGGGNNGNGNGNGNSNNDGPCKNQSDPDGDANGGADKPGGSGGTDQSDQDCNNGSGNDNDGEDDNNGGKKK